MIPQAFITEWSQNVPWQTNEQVEQDLIICRALVEIFSDEWLADRLAFRGGTALHKLYLEPQPRYSEDIDLVQLKAEPIKETIQRIQSVLNYMGESTVKAKRDGIQVLFRFDSEFPPVVRLRLKVETNTREHFSILGFSQIPFGVNSSWFSRNCEIKTYKLEELLGTKLRALYQRKKGRDLFDLFSALSQVKDLDEDAILHCYREYMKYSVKNPPSVKEFMLNMDSKLSDDEFIGDTTALLRPNVSYNPQEAYELVAEILIRRI